MKTLCKLTLGAGLLALPLVSSAIPGYVTDSSGTIVRTNFGECWHTSEWTPDMAVVGCDGKVEEPPPPPPPPVVQRAPEPREERITLSDEGGALFAFGKDQLSANGAAQVDELIGRMRTYERVDHVVITGHTDRIGSEAYNMNLSQRRAETVRNYLVDRGAIPASKVEVEARGESEPVVGCEGVRGRSRLIECLAPNRRVEIEVSGVGMR